MIESEGIFLGRKTESGVQPLFFLKCLLFSYIVTALLMMLLALFLYKAGIGESIVRLGIILIYVVSTFFAGFITGKKMQTKKYLWGLMVGSAYFAVLLLASLAVHHSLGDIGNSFMTTFVLCAGGGMLGGMTS